MIPSRFVVASPPDARSSRLARFLTRTDPLADDAMSVLAVLPRPEQERLIGQLLSTTPGDLPPPLARFHEWLRDVPVWFDDTRADAGGAVLLRGGVLSGLVLGLKSLVLGYCSPAGNKPLAFSGRLDGDVSRRLAETARFVGAVSEPGGLHFGSPGFEATVRVRLIHARVRHALDRSPRWKADAWGAPINQYDMAGTVLLFSSILLEGLRELGVSVTPEEEDATLHQWRAVGRLMGVDDELLCTSASEARALWARLEATQALPDTDSRRLTYALLNDGAERGAPAIATDLGIALCRTLIGPRYADALELPRSPWELAPRVLRGLVRQLDGVVRHVPGASSQALRLGAAHWRRVISQSGDAMPFVLPTQPLRAANH